jgi:hypothetical protein
MGILLYGIIMGVSSVLYEGLIEITVFVQTGRLPVIFGIPFLTAGIYYPLVCTKIGEGKSEGLIMVVTGIAVGIASLLTWAGNIIGLTQGLILTLVIAKSVIFYVISYVITCKLYTKIDF